MNETLLPLDSFTLPTAEKVTVIGTGGMARYYAYDAEGVKIAEMFPPSKYRRYVFVHIFVGNQTFFIDTVKSLDVVRKFGVRKAETVLD